MVSAEGVLKHYNISIATRFNDEMRIVCPFHNDTNPSLDMKTNGSWICRSGCGGGGLIQFVMRFEKVGYNVAKILLENDFSLFVNDDISSILKKISEIENLSNFDVIDEQLSVKSREMLALNILRSSRFEKYSLDWFKILIYVMSDQTHYETDQYLILLEDYYKDYYVNKT